MRPLSIVPTFLVIACSGPAPSETPAAPKGASGSALERFFPLEDGNLYHYVTKDGDETGMLVAKVKRTDPKHGELQLSNKTNRFVYAADGITYDHGIYILKAPIELGTSWPGEHGGIVKIAATDSAVDVAAGKYAGCVKTNEEGGALPPGKRYETTYCPGVGMVLLVVSAPVGQARAELKSYGKPVVIPQ